MQNGQLSLRIPYIIYYSPSGNPLFTSMNTSDDVDFLNKFPNSVPAKLPTDAGPQPLLSDYLQIFPSIAAYKTEILKKNHPVLITVCDYTKEKCQTVKEALNKLKSSPNAAQIQIIDISLTQSVTKP